MGKGNITSVLTMKDKHDHSQQVQQAPINHSNEDGGVKTIYGDHHG
jgi:hypothetical protein